MLFKQLGSKRGFTLVEVLVVAGIIAILAGILVPLIFKEIDESKISRAAADVRSISTALIVFKKDTGQWPVNASCTPNVTILAEGGNLPTFSGAGWDISVRGIFSDYLNTDDNGCWPNTWKGPYLPLVTSDPWGHTYISNAKDYTLSGPIWILSAGPDGIVNTNTTDNTVAGDDIGVRLR